MDKLNGSDMLKPQSEGGAIPEPSMMPETTDISTSQPSEPQYNEGITQGNFDRANKFVFDHLVGLNNVGTASLIKSRIARDNIPKARKFAEGVKVEEEDELPVGPGNTYLTHLFKAHGLIGKINKAQEMASEKGVNIYTDQEEALKLALSVVGCYSDKNPGGMPIDIHEAKTFWFGDKEVDPIQEAEFRATVELGDTKIDPKRVRRFTNHDGSLTWEILNHDKTVMSRFTVGNYNGTKIFAQGGYKKFAELLGKAKGKLGKNTSGMFNAMRSKFAGE